MNGNELELSKNFERILKIPNNDLLAHINDSGTEMYEARYNGRKIYSGRLTVMKAAGIVRSFLYNKENIISACECSDKVTFKASDALSPYDKMTVDIKNGRAYIALTTKHVDESLLKLYSPKIEEWFSAVDRSEDADVDDFQSKVEFLTKIIHTKVMYAGKSYMILIDSGANRIWSFEDGYTKDITSPGFKGALQKLHFMSTIA